jgi:hypothetical protein
MHAMPQPRFDHLRECLLRAGIAPRHVRRYIGELRDHFDDLVREAKASGALGAAAEAAALARLGNENDLVAGMLARPGLRSIASRYPWAVFGLGPVAMLIAGLVVAVLVEIGVLDLVTLAMHALGWKPQPSALKTLTLVVEVWNTLAVYASPLGFAALLFMIGARQRMSSAWVFAGVAIVCIFGGFQNLVWYDTGTRGEMMLTTGLLHPYPHFAEGVARAAANLALSATAWWLFMRRLSSPETELSANVG